MLKLERKENQQFYDYWCSKLNGELMPKRTDFLPEEIPNLLPYICILELISKEDIKFRLSGSEVSRRAGFERTNTNYLDTVAPERRAKASEAFWAAATQPCGTIVRLEYIPKLGVRKLIEGIGVPVYNPKNVNPLLYYCMVECEAVSSPYPKGMNEKIELVNVSDRQFFDLGAGLPEYKD